MICFCVCFDVLCAFFVLFCFMLFWCGLLCVGVCLCF